MNTIQIVIAAALSLIVGFLAVLGADRVGRELAMLWYDSKRKRAERKKGAAK